MIALGCDHGAYFQRISRSSGQCDGSDFEFSRIRFNKCSKNSPTSSGGEMNCTSEHICSKKSL